MDTTVEILHVRLKFYLARQIEVRDTGLNISNQQAAILAAVMWMEQYTDTPLNQHGIAELLHTAPGIISGHMKNHLVKAGLATESKVRGSVYYTITEAGKASLYKFADEILGIPEEVENEMLKGNEYRNVAGTGGELIDKFLRKQFIEAKTKKASPRGRAEL